METNNIQQNLKKYFYSGVGFAAHSSDIMKNAMKEFVNQGKLSEKDGQKIVKDAIGKIEERYNEAAQKLGKYAISEIAMLRKKIESLEKKVSSKGPTAAKAVKAAKKAVPVKKAAKKASAAIKKATKKPVAKKAARKRAA